MIYGARGLPYAKYILRSNRLGILVNQIILKIHGWQWVALD